MSNPLNKKNFKPDSIIKKGENSRMNNSHVQFLKAILNEIYFKVRINCAYFILSNVQKKYATYLVNILVKYPINT